jgi:hypothetical protein
MYAAAQTSLEDEHKGVMWANTMATGPGGFFSFVPLITTVPHSAEPPQGHPLYACPKGPVTGFQGLCS